MLKEYIYHGATYQFEEGEEPEGAEEVKTVKPSEKAAKPENKAGKPSNRSRKVGTK